MIGGGLSSRQLVWVGIGLVLFGVFILTHGSIFTGVLLCGIGAAMLGKRYLAS